MYNVWMTTSQIIQEAIADVLLLMYVLHEKLSENNHYMSPVQDWVAQLPHLWLGLWGQTVRPLDVSDDLLAEITRRLSLPEIWEPLEQKITQRMVRVYELPSERVRLDTTTAKVYGGNDLSVLFQRGYSKDRRPDLRQLKIMLAAQSLGFTVGSQVIMENKLQLALALSEEILLGIETESLKLATVALRCLRLARLISDESATQWLQYENSGYLKTPDVFIENNAFIIACNHGRETEKN